MRYVLFKLAVVDENYIKIIKPTNIREFKWWGILDRTFYSWNLINRVNGCLSQLYSWELVELHRNQSDKVFRSRNWSLYIVDVKYLFVNAH